MSSAEAVSGSYFHFLPFFAGIQLMPSAFPTALKPGHDNTAPSLPPCSLGQAVHLWPACHLSLLLIQTQEAQTGEGARKTRQNMELDRGGGPYCRLLSSDSNVDPNSSWMNTRVLFYSQIKTRVKGLDWGVTKITIPDINESLLQLQDWLVGALVTSNEQSF